MNLEETTAVILEAAALIDRLPADAFKDSDLHAAGQRLLAVVEGRLAAVKVHELDVFSR